MEVFDAEKIFDALINREANITEVCHNSLLDYINCKLESFKESHKSFRTSKLWFQFMDMVDILRRFIKAERVGDWNLHLHTIKEMLPYLAASGHNIYVKSARVYLPQMNGMEETNPDVSAFFQSGCHVVRRSDKLWAGLSSDLMIEQVIYCILLKEDYITDSISVIQIDANYAIMFCLFEIAFKYMYRTFNYKNFKCST